MKSVSRDSGFGDPRAAMGVLRNFASAAVNPRRVHMASTAAGPQGTALPKRLPLLVFSGLALTILAAQFARGHAPARSGRSARVESSKARLHERLQWWQPSETGPLETLLSPQEVGRLLASSPRRNHACQLRHQQQPSCAEGPRILPDQGGFATTQLRRAPGSKRDQSSSHSFLPMPQRRSVATSKPHPTSRLADVLERIAARIRAHRLSETEE